MFVRGISRGGLFVGLLRIDTHSESDSESISSELQGSYGLFSADAEANFKKVQHNYRSEIFVQMYHEGGPTDLKIQDRPTRSNYSGTPTLSSRHSLIDPTRSPSPTK